MAAFQTSTEGNIHILSVSGRLDPNSGKDFKDTITTLTEGEGKDLLVDLEELTYMASAGFRSCFWRAARSGADGGGWW